MMNKDDCISELRSGDPTEEAISAAAEMLSKGSKSWKGYRRFKRKYVNLNRQLIQFKQDLINSKNVEALILFNKYFVIQEDN